MSVIGYDNIERASTIVVPLTTIAQDYYKVATEASKILLQKLSGRECYRPIQIYLKPSLIVRQSAAPYFANPISSSVK
jgi:DNA-binding LacI/PurR family transcriptional regulator